MNYFFNCKTLEEAGHLYHKLSNQCTNKETLNEINVEYYERCKSIVSGGKEIPPELESIIHSIIRCNGINIEIIDSNVWVTGNTYPYRTHLRSVGLKWCSKRKAWNFSLKNCK